jgi:hypothetical protein
MSDNQEGRDQTSDACKSKNHQHQKIQRYLTAFPSISVKKGALIDKQHREYANRESAGKTEKPTGTPMPSAK